MSKVARLVGSPSSNLFLSWIRITLLEFSMFSDSILARLPPCIQCGQLGFKCSNKGGRTGGLCMDLISLCLWTWIAHIDLQLNPCLISCSTSDPGAMSLRYLVARVYDVDPIMAHIDCCTEHAQRHQPSESHRSFVSPRRALSKQRMLCSFSGFY
jgi:hypothetical protein